MNYSNIAKKIEIKEVTSKKNNDIITFSPLKTMKNLVVNYVPPRKSSRYDDWEKSYYRHLRNMCDLFISELWDVLPELQDYFDTDRFFFDFCTMIRDGSSGYISPYLESLNRQEKEDYSKYLIKRKEF